MFAILVFTLATSEIVLKEKNCQTSRAHNPGPERSILVVTYNWVGGRSYLASKPPPQTTLGRLFLRPFQRSRKAFAIRFSRLKYFAEKIEVIWTFSFKIRAKMEVENICIAFHFADKFASVDCVCWKCVSSRLVTVKTLLMSLKYLSFN